MNSARPAQVRYSSEYYSNALYGTYSDVEQATREAAQLRRRLIEHGYPKVAASVYVD